MKTDHENDWDAEDATWKLLGSAASRPASGRFADDTLRAVKLLPESKSPWPKLRFFAPWAGAAACAVLAAVMFFPGSPDEISRPSPVVKVSVEEKWVEIAEVADIEMLSAAADDLDSFSDQELVALVGF